MTKKPDLSHIIAPLRPLAVPLADLKADPGNARTHDDRNIDAVAASLTRFGQQKPVVCDAKGRLIAGHATVLAAKRLGWTHLAAVRSDLSGPDRTAFAIADNRTAELAAWDPAALAASLKELENSVGSLAATGFDEKEIAKLLASVSPEGGDGEGAGDGAPAERWCIVIECKGEADQKRLLRRFAAEGLECKAVIG